MTMANTPKRAFAVWWKDLERWSVTIYRGASWQWPASVVRPLSFALERRSEPVNRLIFDVKPEHFISLRFTGEIEQRDLRGKTDFKGSLFFARAGDIIYSKIDVRNGAIGIIPDKHPVVTVTSEFPVYRIKKEIALSEYIQLVFRTEYFRKIVNGMVSGTSGRKRVQPEDLEKVEIPLPSLNIQKNIVDRWRKAREAIGDARKRIEKYSSEINARFFADLGLPSPDQLAIPKAFAVLWADFDRWGVRFNFLNQSGADLSRGKYPVVQIGSTFDLVQYGTNEKANTSENGIAVIRMNNIVDGQIDLTDLKYVHLLKAEIKKLVLQDGDILFNRTNSKDLVGKCAVFHAKGEFVFASYLIRVRVNSLKADPDYLAFVLNSAIGRQQINALSRQIIGQANINSEELRSLQIPLPPLPLQKKIMERVEESRTRIAREREVADEITKSINAEIEALIVGTIKVSE